MRSSVVSMDEETIATIVRTLQEEHPHVVGGWALDDLERTLRLVPGDGGVWRIADSAAAVYVLVPNETLITITLTFENRQERVRMTSRPLEGAKIIVGLDWGERPRPGSEPTTWRETRWTFRYAHQDETQLDEWQTITGRVRTVPEPEQIDRNEAFARSLLTSVGRRAAVVEGDMLRRLDEWGSARA
jgi:hypothetical protein